MSAVFLDRDGVIVEEVDLLFRAEQLRLLPGAAAAIRRLNELKIKAIVVTNQAVVARGMVTEAGMDVIHERLRQMLAAENAILDQIYYCPYHENANLIEYRRFSHDRKPETGMLEKGAQEFGLELSRCFMVGDTTSDILAGRNAGCRTILVRTGHGGVDGKHPCVPDAIAKDLSAAVDIIVDQWGPVA